MTIKFFLAFGWFFISQTVQAQHVSAYFEKIRYNTATLTAFMAQMPKGGDLHHHYSGSVYAETYLDHVIGRNFFINRTTGEIASPDKSLNEPWATAATLKAEGLLEIYKQKLLAQWSVKDFNPVNSPSDRQFFDAFGKFGSAVAPTFNQGLIELKKRAIEENVSYIESMLTTIPSIIETADLNQYNQLLHESQTARDEQKTMQLLDTLYQAIMGRDIKRYSQRFNDSLITVYHKSLKLDDDRFAIRFQNFVIRSKDPVDLFKSLLLSCESDRNSDLIVGVNIVAPENGETSMADYWLHMMMFRYCHGKYPDLNFALHAGELVLGMVKPEELTWHINAAVHIGGARRIGHGVAIAYEKNVYDLLRYMSRNKIAVELNLSSNEFILNVKDDRHPIMLYKAFGVPITISSDDAGVLRTSLTEQYVLLAKRYKDISYADIKQFVYNSIRYSFISELPVKQRVLKDLDERFRIFEASILRVGKSGKSVSR
ncbi:adenosine deaminase [Spirosoma sp.]|uniref:adenosine deaminase n=1 Tax=Spirosoma sp. TaxID=1899569 RepID=UPI00261F9882|nr:adenosine deaminase [Spirosoma sp.]MCX6215899.1 adenosine deaminase [Spirosoma sp.]